MTLSQATTVPVTVHYDATGDWQATGVPGFALGAATAAGAGQFVLVPSTVLTIPKDKTQESITVTTLPNVPTQYAQHFTVFLSSPTGATLEDADGTGTVLPRSATPGFSVGIGDTSIREPASGTRTADMTVSFSEPAAKKFTLTAATTSAASPNFAATKETVSVPAKATSALVPVTVLANAANKSSATISVSLSSSTGTVNRAVGTLEVRGDSISSTRAGRVPGPPRVSLLGDSITSNYTDFVKPVLEAEGYAVFDDGIPGIGDSRCRRVPRPAGHQHRCDAGSRRGGLRQPGQLRLLPAV